MATNGNPKATTPPPAQPWAAADEGGGGPMVFGRMPAPAPPPAAMPALSASPSPAPMPETYTQKPFSLGPTETYTQKPLDLVGQSFTNMRMELPSASPAPAPSAPSYQYADGTTGTSPWVTGADGRVRVNADGSVSEGRLLYSDAPAGGGGGRPQPTGGAAFGGTATGGGGAMGGGGFGVGQVQGPVDDASRRRVEEAILARLEPQFRKDESTLRNQLLSSGLEVGSPAYTSELMRLQQGQNDARQQAVLTGGTEESRQVGLNSGLQGQAFGQGMQGAQFDNAVRQQMLQEMLLQRNTPLNELNALRTGSQVAMPTFGNYYTNNAAPAPIFDASVAQGNYDAQAAANQQSGINGLLGAGAAVGSAYFF